MNKKLVNKLLHALDGGKDCCGSCSPCIDPIVGIQYSHSLARFNDTSSQTVAASQQAFMQQQAAHGAHLLALTADITSGRPST